MHVVLLYALSISRSTAVPVRHISGYTMLANSIDEVVLRLCCGLALVWGPVGDNFILVSSELLWALLSFLFLGPSWDHFGCAPTIFHFFVFVVGTAAPTAVQGGLRSATAAGVVFVLSFVRPLWWLGMRLHRAAIRVALPWHPTKLCVRLGTLLHGYAKGSGLSRRNDPIRHLL